MAIKNLEVLSPAGSMESLIAAVRSGADAVYLGSKEFSARRNAENFDNAALKEAVEYCHIRGVKVYLTLNTLVRQKEIDTAMATAENAYMAGIDGIILQDLGLARLIHSAMPSLELHASTQMSIHSPAALEILKGMGFSRVVAAREMSAEALSQFCAKAKELNMEVEVFVHGALCMSVSGQCLLSAVLGARSGNRGLCAGPCRLPFSADGGTGYDLSLKDLSLFKHIPELAKMGVTSLKIEGRMKRPEYVAAATAACRLKVDGKEVSDELEDALKGVFSRSGFTDGYFTHALGRQMFGIRTKDDVVESKDTFAALHQLYRNERPSVEIKVSGQFVKDEPAKVTVTCGDISATAIGDIPETAKSRPTTKEEIVASLSKLGSTPYFCNKIDIEADNDLFIRNSVLNQLRRDALENLDKLRSSVPEAVVQSVEDAMPTRNSAEKPIILARVADADHIPFADEADLIAYPIEQEIPTEANPKKLVAELPRWIESEAKIKDLLLSAKEKGVTAALCGNLSAVAIAKSFGFKIIGDIGLNLYNNHSLKAASALGCDSAILSAETTATEAKHTISPIPIGLFAYGRLPLMLLKNCPLKNGTGCSKCDKKGFITDRLGIQFPIRCRMGYSQLLNSAPTYLADKLEDLKKMDFLYLYFTTEENDEISRIIGEYRNGGNCPENFTRGLTYRPSL